MFKSIRGILLFWYALILVAAFGGFSAAVYFRLRSSMRETVDAELRARAEALAFGIEGEPEGPYVLELAPDFFQYFQQTGPRKPYYAVWNAKGGRVDQQGPPVEIPFPADPSVRDRGESREIAVRGNYGAMVLVGKSVLEERERLEGYLALILGAGGLVMVLALAGGWFVAGRALAPVVRMTRVAEAVSASNLSQRIDVARTESELGKLAGTLNVTFDRLESAFERQTRFTADASHELRTPLSILMSHSELALRKERSAPEYREALETCLKAAQRMKAVVEGLLTLARADAKEQSLVRERVDLQRVVEETASSLAPLATDRKVSLSVRTEAVELTGDPERLREAVTNLVMNAIRYNREGGRVEVRLEAGAGAAVLSVADTGIGISEKDRPHIFERFFRVDKARSQEMGGNGLGLAITKWIVESHGGTIAFESRENEGTTFTVRLALG